MGRPTLSIPIVETMKNKQHNVYMHRLSKTITIEAFLPRLEDHPLLAIGSTTEHKPPGNHLSDVNYGLRTKLDFSVLLGYTAHGDPKPQFPGDKQMTYLWCRCTHGPSTNEVKYTLCNLLAHLADFAFPFPRFKFGVCRPKGHNSSVGHVG